MFVFLRRPDPAETAGDAPAMRVHGKDLTPQRIHHHAARHFFANSRQRQQKSFGLLIAHLAQRLQRRLAELFHNDVEQIADRTRFLVRQAATRDRPRDIFGGRFGDLVMGGEGFFQRAVSAAVARLAGLGAANDEQQFVQRIFEVVVVEVAVAILQSCGNVKNC